MPEHVNEFRQHAHADGSAEIDPGSVRAEFKEGVLNVILPEAPAANPKLIDVNLA